MEQRPRTALIEHFTALEDPRQQAKVLYPLPEIVLLVLCATPAGADDFVEMQLWGKQNLGFLRRFPADEHGVPWHDTLGEVIRVIDPALFKACFTSWVAGLRDDAPDIVAIDGKTSRRTHAWREGREPLHLVSAWASRQRLVLGQPAVSGKSNEITAIPLLLERLASTGALVTIDAIGTQNKIAEIILAGGGDYLLALQANRPAMYNDVRDFFADPACEVSDRHQTIDADHRRIEVRRHALCHDVGWLFSDRRSAGEPAFPGLSAIAMVEAETERDGKTTRERRCYLLPARLDAKTFARAARPLAHREPPAPGPRRGLPQRPRAPEDRQRPRKQGRRQTHGHEHPQTGQADNQPRKPKQTRRLEPRLPRPPHQGRRTKPFTRFPWRRTTPPAAGRSPSAR